MNQIKPKKSLGQHFLHDGNIIRRIADSIAADADDLVIEIGPGTGMLTRELLNRYSNIRAVEIDGRAVDYLKKKFPSLDVIHADFLNVSWDSLMSGYEDKNIHIVGNLPYFITSQILFKVLEHRKYLASATLMMQKEVAERVVAKPRTKEYGILSVQTQLMSTPEILFGVPPQVFSPPPNVKSAVIKLTFDKPELNCSDKNLKTVVRMAFNQRRKMLKNALKRLNADLPVEYFDFNLRAEALAPSEYEQLTGHLEKMEVL